MLMLFDAPGFLWLLGALLPLVALFLLKRKRREVVVSSNMLWSRALRDTLARSPFRRPSEWLSLILLLIAAACLALAAAAMRLGIGSRDQRMVAVVLDLSASMATHERAGERIEIARGKLLELIGSLRDGDRMMLVGASRTPQVLSHPSEDGDWLRRTAREAECRLGGADLLAAVQLATQAASRESDVHSREVVVLSDFAAKTWDFSTAGVPGVQLTLVTCGEAASNVGITQLDVSSGEYGVSLLAEVQSHHSSGERTLSLWLDDTLIDARSIPAGEHETRSVVFRLPDDLASGGARRMRVELDGDDAFGLDDRAFVGVRPTTPPRILVVGERNPFLDKLGQTMPGVAIEHMELEAYVKANTDQWYELAIFLETPQQAVTARARNELYLGCFPPGTEVGDDGDLIGPEVMDARRDLPWMRGINPDTLQIAKAIRLVLPPDALALLSIREGVQLATFQREGRRLFIWASELQDSTLVLRPAFPVLVRNILGASLGAVEGLVGSGESGAPLALRGKHLHQSVQVQVRGPDHAEHSLTVNPGDAMRIGTWDSSGQAGGGVAMRDAAGLYEIQLDAEAGREQWWTGLGLLAAGESDIAPRAPQIAAEDNESVITIEAEAFSVQRPVWHWLAMGALVLLLVEWMVWVRSVRGG